MKKYILNVLMAFDQWWNAALGGDPQETISARAGRQQHTHWWARALCWGLDKLDPCHCDEAAKNLDGHLRTDDSVLP